MRSCGLSILSLFFAAAGVACAEDPGSKPLPTPLTRPEMKQYLGDIKARKPRIPLPELTAEEKVSLGEREASYESRLRSVYMPPSER